MSWLNCRTTNHHCLWLFDLFMVKEIDDTSITNCEGLLRRIPNWPNMYKFDQNTKKFRPTSALFSDRDKGYKLSVTLEKPLLDSGEDHHKATHKIGFGLAKIIAGFVRTEITPNQIIQRSPTSEDPHHGLVIGEKNKSTRRALAKHAEIIIDPKTEID